ncbi:MAG: LysR substrate-binding domain-containing protein [Rhizobium sp.]|nr:LysR substrate-binding domain-containing protein [Rhizobium sp.]MDM8012629.1 LysR substrate-binding domain-containing protein [Rhizobium sp.]
MKNRKNLPVAALRAFEAASRHGTLTEAAEELSVTHSAISRHVSHLEAAIGTQLFEGPRNRPRLTPEGRVFGFALTAAFDQIEDALRLISRGEDSILDVACLSTFAIRWLVPRLHDFTARHPGYDVRLATDDRAPRNPVDVEILIMAPGSVVQSDYALLFKEQLGLIFAPSIATGPIPDAIAWVSELPRLETRTRINVWQEWAHLIDEKCADSARASRTFDHYHLTIEAALNGLGAAIAPWHLVATDVIAGRLLAPFGFHQSEYSYFIKVTRRGRRKTQHFVEWLTGAIAEFPPPMR